MKKLGIKCKFRGGTESEVNFYIGSPENEHHPIHFQADMISKKGGSIPDDFMKTLDKLHHISMENNVNFEELVQYAISSSYTYTGQDQIKNQKK